MRCLLLYCCLLLLDLFFLSFDVAGELVDLPLAFVPQLCDFLGSVSFGSFGGTCLQLLELVGECFMALEHPDEHLLLLAVDDVGNEFMHSVDAVLLQSRVTETLHDLVALDDRVQVEE